MKVKNGDIAMGKIVWVVRVERYSDADSSEDILGVYDNEADAIARVNEVFDKYEDDYIENYGGVEEFSAENHHNGYAELHLDCGWDETIIRTIEYEINKPYEII